MIEFLLGALDVLFHRGEAIIAKLEKKKSVLALVSIHCDSIVDKTRHILQDISDKQAQLISIKEAVDKGVIRRNAVEPLLRNLLNAYHDFRREFDSTEEFFAGHISRFNRDDKKLTRIAAAMWTETGLPGVAPIAVTSSSGYFYTVAPLGIIFAPPSGANSLLILPDLYHEFGHIVDESSSLVLYGLRFQRALEEYKKQLALQIRRHSRPLKLDLINDIAYLWEKYWAEEVACDTLAARIVGPAYGWCNLHLCLRNPEVYAVGKHPADVSRTRHIFRVLRRCGWGAEVDAMEKIWSQYLKGIKQRKPANHDDYHPDDLFIAVMEDVDIASKSLISYTVGQDSIIGRLNEAWKRFLADPGNYAKGEPRLISDLHQTLVSPIN
jgi:hypothetical protein